MIWRRSARTMLCGGARPDVAARPVEIARKFLISGDVQGVGYRFFAERVAGQHGVKGYVKNLRDGRVEVYAIGTPEQLAGFKEDLARGPRAARVRQVEEVEAGFLADYQNGFFIVGDYY